MKKRIIAAILLLVTVLSTFAGCANYAYAQRDNFGEYAKVDYDALMKQLHTIEIEEEDFAPGDEERKNIVVDEIYNELLKALNTAANKKTGTPLTSDKDMVEYYYYSSCVVGEETYYFNYNMTTPVNTIVADGDSNVEKEVKKAIVERLYNNKFNFADGSVYSITKTLVDERITEDDTIVVSYTLKTTEPVLGENGEELTKTTYTNYAHVELKKGDALFDTIITNNTDNAVLIGAYKNNEDVIVNGDESNVYRNIVISHIVDKKAGLKEITPEAKTEEAQDVIAYTAEGLRREITIPADATITYYVYPVAHVSAPGVDAENGAELIIRYVLGDDISTSDLAVLGSEDYKVTIDGVETNVKALVEKLVDEYKNNGEHYAKNSDAVKTAKEDLDKEIVKAKEQNIKDAVTDLYNATKKDGDNTIRLADEVLKHNGYSLEKEVTDKDGNTTTEAKDKNDKVADLVELLTKFYTEGGKIKFSQLVDGGILTLYTYKDSNGISAVSIVNDINDAFARTDYSSYKNTTAKIDVADKQEKYDYAVDQAQNVAVTAIINNILECKKGEESVKDAIVKEYKASEKYATDFISYDLVKVLLLKSETTESTFTAFIDDLSEYVYGTEGKKEFSDNVAALVAEFKKSATSDYENVTSVKYKKEAYNEVSLSGSTISTYAKELLIFKNEDGSANAMDALAQVYIDSHPSTVYQVAATDTKLGENKKRVSANSATVLQLILDDIIKETKDVEGNVAYVKDTAKYDDYKAVLVTTENNETKFNYTYTPGLNDSTLAKATDVVKELDAAITRSIDEKTQADKKADYNEAQTEAYEAAVNTYVAKLLSGTRTEENETLKLSVVLAKRYVDSKINEKVSAYNSSIETKLAKAIYEIIVNGVNDEGEPIVDIDHNHKNYPEELVDEFYKTVLENYEYTYYTGTSTVKTPGTPASGVTPEMRAEYDKWIGIYNEAGEAMTTAETGMSNALTVYLTTIATIYEMETVIKDRAHDAKTLVYFNTEAEDEATKTAAALAKAYYDAKNAQKEASTTKTTKNTALTSAKTALAQAEKYLETAKNEKIDFSEGLFTAIIAKNAAVKDAKASVKNAEAALATAQAEYDAAVKDLETKTEAFEDAKEAIENSFTKKEAKEYVDFVDNQKAYNDAKDAYDDAYTVYTRAKSTYTSKHNSANTTYSTKKTAYDNAKAAVEAAGESVTEEQTKALADAEKAMNEAKEALDAIVNPYNEATEAYRNAAIEYSKASVTYYAYAGAVEANAKADYDNAVAVLDDKKDDDGKVTEKGLKTLISESEGDTAGTTMTNLEAYATFEDYLVATLGYNYKAELRAEAQEMLDEQIKVYAVAKALQNGVVANGADVVIGEGEEKKTIHVDSYWKTLEGMETTLKDRYTHSLTHDDENMRPGKIKREVKKYWKELEKSTKSVFVTNKVYNQFKNDIGHSNYNYYKEQYGDNNLRMYLQFENLLTYLLSTDYQKNQYALHDGEYTVKEENGALKYLFITYTTVPADAE